MISKELLSEVLEKKAISKIEYDKLRNIVEYQQLERYWEGINIYELAYKCKEWAFWNDYRILIKMTIPDIYRSKHKINYNYEIYHTDGILDDSCSWFDTEQEAIFEACQYILDNKGTN